MKGEETVMKYRIAARRGWRLRVLAGALVATGADSAALAHGPAELAEELRNREAYFQQVDQPTPEFALQDADGNPVRLADIRGKIVVLHFIYATCPDFCPLHADKIAEVQGMVADAGMTESVQFLSVTTDPETDTPEMLREYGPRHGLDPTNWVFLTIPADAAEDTTRRLAESFGHKFTLAENDYQVHGVVTHVIDRDGQWRANFHSLKFESVNLVTYVNSLVNDWNHPAEEKSLWQRFRELF